MKRSDLKAANLLLTFLLELAVLFALGYWGFQTGLNILFQAVCGIGAPIVAIVIWALFGSPRAKWHLNGIWRILLLIVFYGSGALALFFAGQTILGVIFALIVIVNIGLNAIWKQ